MYATHRRYEGIDQSRIEELSRKVNDGLIPRLSEMPGFQGYFLIEAGDGVVKSMSLFDTAIHAEDSSRVAAESRSCRDWPRRTSITSATSTTT